MQSTHCCCQSSVNFDFLDSFSKNCHIPNFIKIRPVGTELFHADGQIDITKLIAFRDFVNASNESKSAIIIIIIIIIE
jgi:hypothetical protein